MFDFITSSSRLLFPLVSISRSFTVVDALMPELAYTRPMAYRFDVSTSTTSSIILKWVDIIYIWLKHLIKWPSREDLLKTTPMSFWQYFIIIDCFEIFINQPKNLMAIVETFSSYKHHNTIKVLIGITP